MSNYPVAGIARPHYTRGGVVPRTAWGPTPAAAPRARPGPTVRLPQILAYLQDQDVDRAAGFKSRLKIIEEYLSDCDRLRREGHVDFDAKLTGILYEAQTLTKVHRDYERITKGLTRPYNIIPRKLKFPTRQAFYFRKPPMPCPNPDEKPSVYTSLIPRREAIWHPAFVTLRQLPGRPDWDNYYASADGRDMIRWYRIFRAHENQLWNTPPGTKGNWAAIPNFRTTRNPNALNYAEIEEETYQRCMLLDDVQTVNPPPITPLNIPSEGGDGEKAITRGWKRAMIQRCLNLVDNSENRQVNSPWRRVIFPPRYEKFKEVHYQPKALARELRNINTMVLDKRKDRCAQSEPSPWIFWYNQYLQQMNYLAAWSRQAFVGEHWKDLDHIAVPVNYTGPHVFVDKCIYHDYWLDMGKSLVLLWNLINREAELEAQRASPKTPPERIRRLIHLVAADIWTGVQGGRPDIGVVPRPNIDTVQDDADTFQLVDEIDMAWLRFLVQPSSNRALAGLSSQQPEDTLMILFDHRIQTMFNDLVNNPFKVTTTVNDAAGKPIQRWGRQYIPVNPDLLNMINRGGRVRYRSEEKGFDYWEAAEIHDAHLEPPNELYQFTADEAERYCEALARMGRIEYSKPCPTHVFGPRGETEWWVQGQFSLCQNKSWGTEHRGYVSIPHMEKHPEDRVRWRHKSRDDLAQSNQTYMDEYIDGVLDRVRTSPAPTAPIPRETLEKNFTPERMWKRGDYHSKTVERRRQAPSWDDLVDYRDVIEADVGLSDRTVQFFRNLAYRMGRTLRHYNWLLDRKALPSSFTRDDLHKTLDEWRDNVQQGRMINNSILSHPFKLSAPQEVIRNAQPWHASAKSEDVAEVYTTIRHGIIDDLVRNRTMLYPGRATAYTDRRKFLTQTYDRLNIWSWAADPVRRNHAVYRRERYFDMRRWPLNRQKEATRRRIESREDEDPSLQPVSAWHKYRIVVGPTPCKGIIRGTSGVRSRGEDPCAEMNEILRTLDVPRQKLTLKLWEDFLKDLRQVMGTRGIDTKNLFWRTRIVPPTHQVVPSSTAGTTDTTRTTGTKGTTRSTGTMATSGAGGAAGTTGNTGVKKVKLQPMTRKDEVFIPGPAVFPMGDTLLQQVKISQEIERILDPKPEPGIVSNILGWFRPPPDRVPLLPDIDLNRVPSTNPLKRKVPSVFLARPEEPAAKVPAVTDPTTGGPTRPSRGTKTTTTTTTTTTNPPAGGSKPGRSDYLVRPRQIALSRGPRGPGGIGGTPGNPGNSGNPGGTGGSPQTSPRVSPIVSPGGNTGPSTGGTGTGGAGGHGGPLTPPPSGPPPPHPPPPSPAKQPQGSTGPVAPGKLPRYNAPTGGTGNAAVDAINSILSKAGVPKTSNGSGPPPTVPPKPKHPKTPPSSQPTPPVDNVVYVNDSTEYLDVFHPTAEMIKEQQRQLNIIQEEKLAKATKEALDRGEKHPLVQRFIERMDTDFPLGWATIPTPGTGLLCGFYAIIASMKAQFPGLPVPTVAELQDYFESPTDERIQGAKIDVGMDNFNNFTFDQLGGVLWNWAVDRGIVLQLGVLFDKGRDDPFISPLPNYPGMPEEHFAQNLLWIHNNSSAKAAAAGREKDKKKGLLSAAKAAADFSINHYSGVRHKS